ncbi:hypothetical protein JTB14_037721 [Gonioctena quinquepunctata]|nr:hypothetical protein JTB14_037721 [Gonioctena quinquepunctata]
MSLAPLTPSRLRGEKFSETLNAISIPFGNTRFEGVLINRREVEVIRCFRYSGSSQHTEQDPSWQAKLKESEESSTVSDNVQPTSDYLIPNEITTEPESEQVDFIFFPQLNENIELLDEEGDSNGKSDTEFEEVDPNKSGIHYIYHPNGLLQKVVYAERDHGQQEDHVQLKYEVLPIVEPIYTYDANTFVFQRLQLFTG